MQETILISEWILTVALDVVSTNEILQQKEWKRVVPNFTSYNQTNGIIIDGRDEKGKEIYFHPTVLFVFHNKYSC
jgi:hypothetical protein